MAAFVPQAHSAFGTAVVPSEELRACALLPPCLGMSALDLSASTTAAGPARHVGQVQATVRRAHAGRDSQGVSASPAPKQKKKGFLSVAARTIPFPHPPGNAVTRKGAPTPPPPPSPPPTGAAKSNQASRRYRGLTLVSRDRRGVASAVDRLAQTRAIVQQVEREIAHRAVQPRMVENADLMLLSPVSTPPSLPTRAAKRVVLSLFPAGL